MNQISNNNTYQTQLINQNKELTNENQQLKQQTIQQQQYIQNMQQQMQIMQQQYKKDMENMQQQTQIMQQQYKKDMENMQQQINTLQFENQQLKTSQNQQIQNLSTQQPHKKTYEELNLLLKTNETLYLYIEDIRTIFENTINNNRFTISIRQNRYHNTDFVLKSNFFYNNTYNIEISPNIMNKLNFNYLLLNNKYDTKQIIEIVFEYLNKEIQIIKIEAIFCKNKSREDVINTIYINGQTYKIVNDCSMVKTNFLTEEIKEIKEIQTFANSLIKNN